MAFTIPESHCDLIDGPHWAALTTLMPDGSPQTTPIWCNADHEHILINTMRGFRKEKNLRRNPCVTLLIYDPRNPQRHIEIRGLAVEMTEDGALEHLDQLTQLYLGRPDAHFFGDCVPLDEQARHVPVKITIQPTSVRVEG
ncbi:MAG: PPOX class F420-dependent oxidoreductase [Anaerolineae bacterium]|nr:PPOX class F420-dependent oxidoreductase [Anaerolineae bacterium]